MGFLSFSKILTTLIVLYMLYTLSSFYKIFFIDECKIDENCIHPMFNDGANFEIRISGSAIINSRNKDSSIVLAVIEDVKLNMEMQRFIDFTVPRSIINNQSYIITIDVIPKVDNRLIYDKVVISKIHLTKLRQKASAAFKLLKEKQPIKGENLNKADDNNNKPVMHIYNKIVISSLSDSVIFDYNNIPHEIMSLLKVSRDSATRRLLYQPIVYGNNFVLREEDLVQVTNISTAVNITVQLLPLSLGKLRLWSLIEHSTEDLSKMGFNDKNIDDVRGIFTHTNFYLLMVTFTVAALHLLFDILSFKNDISFWRNAKSTQGLSGRTVMWRCVSSVIIFFYLLEENTSLLVLVPSGVSTVIEFWKLTRVLKVKLTFVGGVREMVGSRDSGELATDKIDKEGMKYLLWLVTPLCICGALYSLLYLPHKSWYSWTVNTLANGVYVFGFLFMMPQLFINYKLKSVAHLPWKALTYKAFNTFIDDFFAFIITMPTSHRLACFRDDIVFLIFLYQKWLYPVDKSRVNEFGDSFENTKEKKIN